MSDRQIQRARLSQGARRGYVWIALQQKSHLAGLNYPLRDVTPLSCSDDLRWFQPKSNSFGEWIMADVVPSSLV
jgi:hypothetical protein